MKKYTIAGIGELLWDVMGDIEEIGGAPINFAYHVTALGARGIAISTIGQDKRGKRAIAELHKRGLEVEAISYSDMHITGYVAATLDGKGVATYNFPDDVAWDHLDINSFAQKIQSQLDAVCFGSLAQRSHSSRRAIHLFLDDLSDHTLKVFDVNLRQNFYSIEIIESSLQYADILKLNDEELPILAKLLHIEGPKNQRLSVLINRYNLKMAILSRGANGSILQTSEDFSEHPGITTPIVDTIGAGDSFTAAVTIGYLQQLDLNDINEKANRLAAYVCSQQGAMPPIPDFLDI